MCAAYSVSSLQRRDVRSYPRYVGWLIRSNPIRRYVRYFRPGVSGLLYVASYCPVGTTRSFTDPSQGNHPLIRVTPPRVSESRQRS